VAGDYKGTSVVLEGPCLHEPPGEDLRKTPAEMPAILKATAKKIVRPF
jgi:hypothetical protein